MITESEVPLPPYYHTMKTTKDQILGGTHLDRDGEKLPVEFLENFVSQVAGRRMPVHQQHQMSKPVVGYVSNIRLVNDKESPEEWHIIGDVSYHKGSLDDIVGGFSISGTIEINRSSTADALIYLPSPHHADPELIENLKTDNDLTIGRWVQKSVGPSDWFVIGSAFVIMFGTPIWQQIYETKISSRLETLLDRYGELFKRKGIKPEYLQYVKFQNRSIEIRFISDPGGISSEIGKILRNGLKEAEHYLLSEPRATLPGVSRLVMFYDSGISAYRVHRAEFLDGGVEHLV